MLRLFELSSRSYIMITKLSVHRNASEGNGEDGLDVCRPAISPVAKRVSRKGRGMRVTNLSVQLSRPPITRQPAGHRWPANSAHDCRHLSGLRPWPDRRRCEAEMVLSGTRPADHTLETVHVMEFACLRHWESIATVRSGMFGCGLQDRCAQSSAAECRDTSGSHETGGTTPVAEKTERCPHA